MLEAGLSATRTLLEDFLEILWICYVGHGGAAFPQPKASDIRVYGRGWSAE
jgi:hypothetical protein